VEFVSREQWGALPPRGQYEVLHGAKGVAVHWYGGNTPAGGHENCAPLVRAIQVGAFNRTDGMYSDIEYNFLVCEHGFVFGGRGSGVKPAAQAAANATYFAVCALTGPSGGSTSPTPALLAGLWDAIEELRTTGPAGPEIVSHRDLMSTDCPGDALAAWVREGAPHGGLPPSPPPPAPAPAPGGLGTRQLHTGESGADVGWLQGQIGVPVDDSFGPVTQGGVMAWQKAHHLANDGIVGPNTWRALGHPMP